MRTLLLVPLLLALVSPLRAASPGSPEETTRRQTIDLETLTIEGRKPSPTTLFIRERTGGLFFELFPLRRDLAAAELPPIDKAAFDKETLCLMDRQRRG